VRHASLLLFIHTLTRAVLGAAIGSGAVFAVVVHAGFAVAVAVAGV